MNFKKKRLAVVMSMMLFVFALVACSNNDTNNTNNDNNASVEAPNSNNQNNSDSEAAEVDETPVVDDESFINSILDDMLTASATVTQTESDVTFIDDSGRDAITIKKNPQKVAVLYGSHACLWTEAGGKVSVGIGGKSTTALYMDQIGRDIMADEGAVTIAESSSAKNWDIEMILAEQPDLIVCSTAMSGYSTISGPAEAANIPVIALTYNGVGDYLKWFKVFSSINSTEALWEDKALVTAKDVATTIAKAPKENNPRVLSLLPLSKGASANLDSSNMGAIIKELNGVNIASELNPDSEKSKVDISLEAIFAAEPEMIFIQCLTSEEAARETMSELFEGNPVWESLDAVKNDKVYYMEKSLFHNRPNHKYNQSYKIMAELLYPELEF